MTDAVEVRHLTKDFRAVRALDDLTLSMPAGHIVGLMGDNGAGKTTLLKILAGVIADWTGEATVLGQAPGPDTKSQVAYLPDAQFLPDSFKPEDCIELYSDFFADFDAQRARDTIQFYGLPFDRTLKEMSKGMQEKAQIALVMARRAKVYLLDEPISGVDPAARQVLLDGIIRNFDSDQLMVISTHLLHDLEPIIDRVVFLRGGRLLVDGDADELRAQSGTDLEGFFRKVYQP